MRILLISRAFPYPPHDGEAASIDRYLRRLAPRHRITLATVAPADDRRRLEGERVLGGLGLRLAAVPERRLARPLRALECLRDGRPWVNRFYEPELARLVAAELSGGDHDAVLAWGIMSAQHLPRRPGPGPIPPAALMAVDCLSLAHRRRYEATGSPRELIQAIKIRAMERAMGRACRVVLAASPVDAAALRAILPATLVEVLPIGVEAEAFRPDPAREEPGTVLMSGAMDFPPNEEAALWLAREIWPLVRRRATGARLVLAGRSPTAAVAALAEAAGGLPGVTVTGPVASMADQVARAAVVVSPLLQGTGLKTKVMEAAFMAKALVATPVSLEGLPLEPGRDCLVASEAGAFAGAVARLLEDEPERRRLGGNARAAIEQGFAIAPLAARLEAILEGIIKPGL